MGNATLHLTVSFGLGYISNVRVNAKCNLNLDIRILEHEDWGGGV